MTFDERRHHADGTATRSEFHSASAWRSAGESRAIRANPGSRVGDDRVDDRDEVPDHPVRCSRRRRGPCGTEGQPQAVRALPHHLVRSNLIAPRSRRAVSPRSRAAEAAGTVSSIVSTARKSGAPAGAPPPSSASVLEGDIGVVVFADAGVRHTPEKIVKVGSPSNLRAEGERIGEVADEHLGLWPQRPADRRDRLGYRPARYGAGASDMPRATSCRGSHQCCRTEGAEGSTVVAGSVRTAAAPAAPGAAVRGRSVGTLERRERDGSCARQYSAGRASSRPPIAVRSHAA